MSEFQGKVVIVTGSSSGIGESIARRLADLGATVVVNSSSSVEAGEAVAKSLPNGAIYVRADISKKDEALNLLEQTIKAFGKLDILVNNAGITQRSAFVDTQISVYRRVMEVNFFGSLHCTKAAMASLIERRGMIIVIESLAGLAPLLGRTGYCASKHALHGFFTSLRSELRNTGTHIMLVCPGFVETRLQTRALGGDGRVTAHPQSMVGRPVSADSVAGKIYKGAFKRKHLLVLTPVGKLTYWIHRFAPRLYERLMARQLKEELIR